MDQNPKRSMSDLRPKQAGSQLVSARPIRLSKTATTKSAKTVSSKSDLTPSSNLIVSAPPKPKKRRWLGFVVGLVMVVILIFIGLGYYWFFYLAR